MLEHFVLPIVNPTKIFFIVLLIVLVAPILLKPLRTPSIIGLIIAGMLIGENGLGLISGNSLQLMSAVGLLYIMFLAGLDIDLYDFQANKQRSIVFGSLTFFIPLLLGYLVIYWYFGNSFDPLAILLLASMFSTHTLVAYPIVSRYGIGHNRAITVTVGGTIITDTAVLLLIAIIAAAHKGHLDIYFWLKLGGSISLFLLFVWYGIPFIAKWFFRNMAYEGSAQYIFVLVVLFAAATFSELAGLEGIVGAFMAGLALNRLIPPNSILKNRVDFIGNALFIPFFLIAVGMRVDLKTLLADTSSFSLAILMVVTATVTKWLAAFVTQKIYNYTPTEQRIIFGLSNAHAAAILAVIAVGIELGLITEQVLSGGVLIILVSSFISSYITERAARQLVLEETNLPTTQQDIPERFVVSVSNPNSAEQLMLFAYACRQQKSAEALYVLNIVIEDDKTDTTKRVMSGNKTMQKIIREAGLEDKNVQVVSKVDVNVVNGIVRAAKELLITNIVMGWKGKQQNAERYFGTVIEQVVENSPKMVTIVKTEHPINTYNTMFVIVPPNAEAELGFVVWVKMLRNLSKQITIPMTFVGELETLEKIAAVLQNQKPEISVFYKIHDDWGNLSHFIESESVKDDLLFFIAARPRTISHHSYMAYLPYLLSVYFPKRSFNIIYPEQNIA
ncbi:MAG: cation:proton antiporter [Chitinophagales bacterium]|nr:cation:proton antiporter [Chitinophagales bacterium]